MSETKEIKGMKGDVKLEEKKPDVVVSFNLTDALAKATEEFNSLAKQLKDQDETIKKTADGLNAERNQMYTRAVEVQGTIRYLQDQLKAQEKAPAKK